MREAPLLPDAATAKSSDDEDDDDGSSSNYSIYECPPPSFYYAGSPKQLSERPVFSLSTKRESKGKESQKAKLALQSSSEPRRRRHAHLDGRRQLHRPIQRPTDEKERKNPGGEGVINKQSSPGC